jgi:hypothetical protein
LELSDGFERGYFCFRFCTRSKLLILVQVATQLLVYTSITK